MKRQFLGVQDGVWAWQQLGRRRVSRLPRASGSTVLQGCPWAGPQTPRLYRQRSLPCYSYYVQLLQGLPGALLSTYCVPSPGLWLCLDGLSGATQQTWEMRLSPVHKSQDGGSSARKQQSRPKHSLLASGPPPEGTHPAAFAVSQPHSPHPLSRLRGPFRPTFQEGTFRTLFGRQVPGIRAAILPFLGKPRRHFEKGQTDAV